MASIGIVGTGMLGNAVGLRLLDEGNRLFVFNRTAEKTRELEGRGAKACRSPKQVAGNSEILITAVKDAGAVRQVAFGANGIVEGRHDGLVIADMSTISPLESKQIAQRYRESGIEMLDTPVMGGPNVAISGNLVMMAAGDEGAFNRYKSVFETVAGKVFYLGEAGTAHAVKLAMNLQIAMLALALSEGITLARGADVDPEVFLKILNSTYFKTGMSENKAFKMIRGEFSPTFTLENLKKDLHTINQTSESLGIRLPMSGRAEEVYNAAVENGFGGLDYTGILAYIRQIPRP